MTVSRALGVGPSDNYFPDSRSRYGESLIAKLMVSRPVNSYYSLSLPSSAESLENHKRHDTSPVSHHGLIKLTWLASVDADYKCVMLTKVL